MKERSFGASTNSIQALVTKAAFVRGSSGSETPFIIASPCGPGPAWQTPDNRCAQPQIAEERVQQLTCREAESHAWLEPRAARSVKVIVLPTGMVPADR